MKKGRFSKIIVVYCVGFCSLMSVWSMWIADRNGVLVTGVITAILGVFGGELLLLCLKRIFGGRQDADAAEAEKPPANDDVDCD
jgi:hypothetical protein